MINILCNNFKSNEAHWHMLVDKNLKGIKALINSKLCNVYQLDNSLIIEVPAILETMKEVQKIYNVAINNKNYKVVFANQYNYCKNFILGGI